MPTDGDVFEIFTVGGTLAGQFRGQAQNSLVTNLSGIDLFINYSGGDGNDVTLYTAAVPEPAWVAGLGVVLASFCGWLTTRKKNAVRGE